MKLNDLFLKDVNRPIDTVIKADDQEHILTEVEEYVITGEIAKKISDFFEQYNNYQGANGVWISGFFGSGKSHLLKMLSYVLENKAYEDIRLGEIFASKVEDDQMLKGDVGRATRTPSESILFNIDQQAQITSKSDEAAILSVFYKVFYDHLGYFGAQRHVAEFERWLDSEGNYRQFIELFEAHAGEHWNKGRTKYFAPKTKDAAAEALAQINGDSPDNYRDILKTLQKDNRISVEDFGEKVADYINTKEPGFRLNFFVDEVGQYISGNTKLMLNLQTVAETLATKCKGQAWIIATAQEDLEAIVGDESAVQSDDFSKIQGRFKIRIPLTSANVDEVIEKRLLAKKDGVKDLLANHWRDNQANLKTLLSFSGTGIQFRGFDGEKDYISKFPFIPYQFDLFQQCIKVLSKHNAFQGKHQSVGERSMLGVFQEVLKKISNAEIDAMVSFDTMFEGLRSAIRGEIQNTITLAERNLTNELAIRVLKVLFLVKYYTNFETTARNISVLLLSSTSVDLKAHEKSIEEALNLLENQTYIQRNGELYEFLTDDEKDVENEIKDTDIDPQQIPGFLNEVIFDSIIGDNRILFADNKQSYDFSKRIDGAPYGREKELAIEILSPNSEMYGNEDYYKTLTMGQSTLMLLVLPESDRLLQDIRLYLKTEKYYKQNTSTTNNETISRIIYEKQQQNVQRKRSLIDQLRHLLAKAQVYMNGSRHDVSASSDGKTRVFSAFQDLVKLAYPNLRMLKSQYSEASVREVLTTRNDDLFGGDEATMGEAETEVLNVIRRRKKQSDRTSLADLKDIFSSKPYGWYSNATFTMVARLHKRGKIEARQDANILSDKSLNDNLLNNRAHSSTLLEPQQEFDQRTVRKLRDVYNELFNEPCPANEAREAAMAFKAKAKAKARELFSLSGNKAYPFLSEIIPLAQRLEQLADMDYAVLIAELPTYEDELLDWKEETLDPILKFMHGEQKKIFDRINEFFQGNQANFDYVEAEELKALEAVREHPEPYKDNMMREAKERMDKLQARVLQQIDEEKAKTLAAIEHARKQLVEEADFAALDASKQTQLTRPLDELTERTKQQRYIATLRQDEGRIPGMVAEQKTHLQRLANPEKPAQYITMNTVKVSFGKNELNTAEEVEAYTKQLKEELLKHIQQNRRITL